jgi:hypothetical protein
VNLNLWLLVIGLGLWCVNISYYVLKISEDFAQRHLHRAIVGLVVIVGLNAILGWFAYVAVSSMHDL